MAGKLADIDDGTFVLNIVLSQCVAAALGFGIAWAVGLDLFGAMSFSLQALMQILVGTASLIALLFLIRILLPAIARQLDRTAVELFGRSKMNFPWWLIFPVSISAGIGEEILFRGALQGTLALHLPTFWAVLLPSIVFAALHPHSRLFMAMVLVIGSILGFAYAWTDNLLVPIGMHALFDIFAMYRLAYLIRQWRAGGGDPEPA